MLVFGLVYLFIKPTSQRWRWWDFSCVIGGALPIFSTGIYYGSVTDFLYIDLGIAYTGVFNLADVSIVTGLLLVLLHRCFPPKEAGKSCPAKRAAAALAMKVAADQPEAARSYFMRANDRNHPFSQATDGSRTDFYLSIGWYRMGQSIFTTHFIPIGDKIHRVFWLRLIVGNVQFGRKQRRLLRSTSDMSVHYRPFLPSSFGPG